MALFDTRARGRFGRGAATAAVAVTALTGAGFMAAGTAYAADPLSATATKVASVPADEATAVSGFALKGGSGIYLVTVSTSNGKIALSQTAGLTLAYGYTAFSGTRITFTGTVVNVNAALATMKLTAAKAGSAQIRLAALPNKAGVAYLPETQHTYKYVKSAGISYTAAKSAAEASSYQGQSGYLVTMINAAENDLVASKVQGASNVWIGAEATDDTGTIKRIWAWGGGPEEGEMFTQCTNTTGTCTHSGDSGKYQSWDAIEPNNSGGTEDRGVTNWSGTKGKWNDLSATNTKASGYVVEYGGMTNKNSALGTKFSDAAASSKTLTVAAARPVASFTPTSVVAGAMTTLSARHLKVSSNLKIVTPWNTSMTVKADAKGEATAKITIPANRIPGTEQLTLTAVSMAGKSVTVKPSLTVTGLRPVEFAAGSAKVTTGEATKFKPLVPTLKKLKAVTLQPVSTGGNTAANRSMSQKRAESVAALLKANGITAKVTINPASFGATKPVVAFLVTG